MNRAIPVLLNEVSILAFRRIQDTFPLPIPVQLIKML
ncbi:hypothetical protein AU14_18690 [Marinobacter similis]|uniref:Uncharacterized protein n=1 Tax=Marinobacter similis TaxID=1420916 RepID=W5YM83_9GAMM|nr:hypothetical protein AU14_18690 [Marinobacter similis]